MNVNDYKEILGIKREKTFMFNALGCGILDDLFHDLTWETLL